MLAVILLLFVPPLFPPQDAEAVIARCKADSMMALHGPLYPVSVPTADYVTNCMRGAGYEHNGTDECVTPISKSSPAGLLPIHAMGTAVVALDQVTLDVGPRCSRQLSELHGC